MVNLESVDRQNQQMTLKPGPTSGRLKVTSSIVITMNLEFNSMCPRKKHSPFHLISLTWSELLALMWTSCKRNVFDDCWNVDSNRSLSDSWKGFTKVTPLKEKLPKGYMLSREGLTKSSNDYQTWECVAWSMDENWWSRSESRKNKNGRTRGQNSTMLEDRGIYWLILMTKITKKLSKLRGENWKELWHQLCLAKGKLQLAPRKWLQSMKLHPQRFQNDLWLLSGVSWLHSATSGIFSVHKTWRSHSRQRFHFVEPLQFGSQICSYATSDENSGCKGCIEQKIKKSLRQSQHGNWREREVKESPPCYIYRHMSPQKRGVKTPNYKGINAESYSVVTS